MLGRTINATESFLSLLTFRYAPILKVFLKGYGCARVFGREKYRTILYSLHRKTGCCPILSICFSHRTHQKLEKLQKKSAMIVFSPYFTIHFLKTCLTFEIMYTDHVECFSIFSQHYFPSLRAFCLWHRLSWTSVTKSSWSTYFPRVRVQDLFIFLWDEDLMDSITFPYVAKIFIHFCIHP